MGQLGRSDDGKYPDLRLTEAIEIVKKMEPVGRMNKTTLARLLGMDARGAGLHSRVEDLIAYGLIESNGELKLTPDGFLVANGDADKSWEAFLRIPLYAKMHDRILGRDIDNATLRGILHAISQAEEDDITRRITRLKSNYMEALQYRPILTATGKQIVSSSGHTPNTSGSRITAPIEIMASDLAMIEKDGKLYVIIDKDLEQVKQARSYLGLWEKKLENQSKESRHENRPSRKAETIEQTTQ